MMCQKSERLREAWALAKDAEQAAHSAAFAAERTINAHERAAHPEVK